jgi:hypothetical protein
MPIQLSPLMHHHLLHHHLLNFLKRLCVIGDKLWNLDIRQISFLQVFFRRCLALVIGRFVSKRQAESPKILPSTQYDKADHHSHGLFDNVDCFRKLPISFFGRWQRSQSLPLHHEEQYYHPDPQTFPSTSQAVVPYSTTPKDDMNKSTRNNSTCSSTTARAEDNFNRDPPGLSKEISDFVGVTSAEFQRYKRKFTSYVLTKDHQLLKFMNPP